MSAVAGIRSDLESLVLDPSQPGALDQFNALAVRLHADLQRR